MAKIIIYTQETCPYCQMAKNLLKTKGATEFTEIRIDLDSAEKEKMIAKTGRRTVPQIYIDALHVGGFDDLAKLNQQGKLEALLAK